MKTMATVTILFLASLLLVQCNRAQDDPQGHMMSGDQMGQMMENPDQRRAIMTQMMENPEQRQAMMAQMAENPEMRTEFMSHMQTNMMNDNHDQMLDRMEAIMNNPEQRDRMRTQMQNMMQVLESDSLNRDQMREMLNQSPLMGMQMNCMQMTMTDM